MKMKSNREYFQAKSSSFGLLGNNYTKVLILLGLILLLGGINISHGVKGAGREEMAVISTLCSQFQDSQQAVAIFASEVDIQWEQTYGSPDSDEAHAVIQTTDGGFALAGFTTDDQWPGYEEARLVKTDPHGVVEWSRTYRGASRARAFSVIETEDRGFVLAGFTRSSHMAEADGWLAKTDVNGVLQWNQTYGDIGWDEAHMIIETNDGGFAFIGGTWSIGAGLNDFWLVKTDVHGTMAWQRTYGGAGQDDGWFVFQTMDAGYALAGETLPLEGVRGARLVKTNSNGTKLWESYYDYKTANAIIQTIDGGYVFAGTMARNHGSKGSDALLVKLDVHGEIQWMQTYGDNYRQEVYSVIQTTDGGFVLACYTWSYPTGSDDVRLVKTNASGEVEWTQTRGDIGYDIAYSVIQTMDGNFVFAGATTSYGTGESDFWLVKTVPMESTTPSLFGDTTPPSLSKPADLTYEEGTLKDFITWTVEDRHPGTYALYTDSILVDSGTWTNGTITWSPAGLPPGTYNVTLVVWDAPENRSSDTVWVDVIAPLVTVIPTTPTPPSISSTTPPSLFVPGWSGIPMLAALVALGLWRKRK